LLEETTLANASLPTVAAQPAPSVRHAPGMTYSYAPSPFRR
jgi:hypothetical protein